MLFWLSAIFLNTMHWIFYTTLITKLLSLMCAVAFAIIESSYRCAHGGGFYSTYQQFIMSVLGSPIFIIFYWNFIVNVWLRLLMFPFVLWLWELVADRCLKSLYNSHNPAWNYSYSKYSMFSGAIRLDFYFYWLLMGVSLELVNKYIVIFS